MYVHVYIHFTGIGPRGKSKYSFIYIMEATLNLQNVEDLHVY